MIDTIKKGVGKGLPIWMEVRYSLNFLTLSISCTGCSAILIIFKVNSRILRIKIQQILKIQVS